MGFHLLKKSPPPFFSFYNLWIKIIKSNKKFSIKNVCAIPFLSLKCFDLKNLLKLDVPMEIFWTQQERVAPGSIDLNQKMDST